LSVRQLEGANQLKADDCHDTHGSDVLASKNVLSVFSGEERDKRYDRYEKPCSFHPVSPGEKGKGQVYTDEERKKKMPGGKTG
jgi:hypothetical protein